MDKMTEREVKAILEERQEQYGDYTQVANATEEIMEILHSKEGAKCWDSPTRLGIYMIVQKLARIACGTLKEDSLVDIAGYATLIKNHSRGVMK